MFICFFLFEFIIFVFVTVPIILGFFYQGPENSAFLVNIHEPIIWRIHEMIQQVNLGRLNDTQTTAVSVDPIIQIGYAMTILQLYCSHHLFQKNIYIVHIVIIFLMANDLKAYILYLEMQSS